MQLRGHLWELWFKFKFNQEEAVIIQMTKHIIIENDKKSSFSAFKEQ